MNSAFVAKVLKAPRNSMPSSTQTFLGCLCLIIFLKSSAVSLAYFAFSGSTLRYLDRQSTSTRTYFTPLLYFACLSTNARSTDQISFRSLKIILRLGIVRRRDRYLVGDDFISRYTFVFFH